LRVHYLDIIIVAVGQFYNKYCKMKKNVIFLSSVILIIISVSSCVSGRKYKGLQDTSLQYMNERDDLKARNISLEMSNRELEARAKGLDKEIEKIEESSVNLRNERDSALAELSILNSRYNDLQNAQEELIRGNVKETRKLLEELQAAQENLQNKEELLRQLEESLDMKKATLDELNFELEKRNERLVELERILDSQKRIVQDLKDKVSEALLGFENNGLTVTMKNGKVYVSLDEKLLFRSGSWEIDANGRNALVKLAGVLEKNPGIQIMIEGHTDNVPYNPSGSQLRDNWDLSVKRATTVVRVLIEGSRIDPKRLTAAGRGEFMPVDPANNTAARQKNRRTEVVLTPDLTPLYEMINNY